MGNEHERGATEEYHAELAANESTGIRTRKGHNTKQTDDRIDVLQTSTEGASHLGPDTTYPRDIRSFP
jgi:hypothetical protein